MVSSFYERYWTVRKRGGEYCLQWQRFKDYFPEDEGATVVDFGCGKGRIIEEMQKRNSSARYIGLDVSKLAIEEASRLFPTAEFHRIEDGEDPPKV
jgi:tRNA G46 methylase TrmB